MTERRIRCELIEVFPAGPMAAMRSGEPAFQEVSPWSDPLVSSLLRRLLSRGTSHGAHSRPMVDEAARQELPPPRDDDWSLGGLDPAFDDPWHRE